MKSARGSSARFGLSGLAEGARISGFRLFRKARKIPTLPLLILALGILWAVWGDAPETIPYDWQWQRAFRFLGHFTDQGFQAGVLLGGLGVTIRIVLLAFVLSMLFGMVTALMRLSRLHSTRLFASSYVGLVRNTPLLMQLFIVYFVVAPVFDLSPYASAVLSLALFEGAYMAELFRAGITDVSTAQWEAAYSLGMNKLMAFRLVILPQAMRKILPPLASQSVSLIKDSALVSAIAIPDLTMQAQAAIADTFLTFELWILVAVIYLCLTLTVAIPAALLERRLAHLWE